MSSMNLSVNEGATYDVIVMGGGPSGSMAAIAAAREGATVLLCEQYAFLGGSLTAMGVGPMMSFHNRAAQQVVQGLPEELIERLVERNASPGHILDSTGYCSTVTPFDSEALKIELETMLHEAGVSATGASAAGASATGASAAGASATGATILYHTMLADVQTSITHDAHDHIDAIIVCNKSGLTRYRAHTFIDATGDADLSVRAGAPFQFGRTGDGQIQPMTMNLKVANVNMQRLRAYVNEHPEEFPHGNPAMVNRAARVSLGGFISAWKAALERGEVSVPRELVLFFESHIPGVIIVNTSRIVGLDPTDPVQLSKAESIGRQQCAEIFQFLRRYCVGFENCVRMDTSAQVGVRESRHVRGRYTLTAQDLIEEHQFEDPIALGGYPIDIHNSSAAGTNTTHLRHDIAYQIPMRCLLLDAPDNLVVSGRAISATHEAAAAFRVTPIAMAIGQAAGTIAALACAQHTAANQVNYADVRLRLDHGHAYLNHHSS